MEISQQNIIEEYTCPICLNLIVEPVSTICKHNFCGLCIEIMADNDAKITCPICRKKQSQDQIKQNKPLKQEVMKLYKLIYEERMVQYLQQQKLFQQQLRLVFTYGNIFEIDNSCGKNKNKWTTFVKLSNDQQGQLMKQYVQSVKFELHPTFNPPCVTIDNFPFQVVRQGWGTFNITITIKWKKELEKSDTTLDHYLVFDANGSSAQYVVRIDQTKLEQKKEQQIQQQQKQEQQIEKQQNTNK